MQKYDHKNLEKKWQDKWKEDGVYKTSDDLSLPKKYILDMFPYPSGEGLHVGHPRGYIATDVYSRMIRMNGYNVLHPMGFDAFGLPAENFAIKNKVHPRVAVEKNVARFKEQLSLIGFDYDWTREINTTDPEFYKWTQWMFIKMYEKGLAYESYEPINWCPVDKTGLANEDVEADGTCERCGAMVEKKPMRQWVLKITEYADRLLSDLDKLPKWPEGVKEAQRNWIGRSEGAEIEFKIKIQNIVNCIIVHGSNPSEESSRNGIPENLRHWKSWLENNLKENGIGVANDLYPEDWLPNYDKWKEVFEKNNINENTILVGHSAGGAFLLRWLAENKRKVNKLILVAPSTIKNPNSEKYTILSSFKDFTFDETLKEYFDEITVFYSDNDDPNIIKSSLEINKKLGGKLIHLKNRGHFILSHMKTEEFPELLNEIISKIKVFTTRADTIFGATFLAVAGVEDKFTGKYAINPASGEEIPVWEATYVLPEYGTGAIMGVPAHDARDRLFAEKNNLPIVEKDFVDTEEIIKKVNGKKVINYKIKDWVFSRQRYWGEPIPMVHCDGCGVVPVDIKDLPIKLPEVENYEPSGTGESPLANIIDWVNTKCPKCGGDAKHETNTMPQWAGSSWYYLRYIDPKNDLSCVDLGKEKAFMPVDVYVGGDHATRHLIYARFWHKFLFDIGVVSTEEPFPRLEFLGFILAPDGRKMSKRWGNVINPDDMVERFGADAFRLYTMFIGPFENTVPFNEDGMVGTYRFLERIWKLAEKINKENVETNQNSKKLLHKTIKKVGEDIENFKFNTAVSQMMICINELENISVEDFKKFLQVLAPFAPHMAEELWQNMGEENSIHLSLWPKYDESLVVDDEIKIMIQVNGKVRGEVVVGADEAEDEIKEKALTNEQVKKFTLNQEIKKVVYVKGRLINIVV